MIILLFNLHYGCPRSNNDEQKIHCGEARFSVYFRTFVASLELDPYRPGSVTTVCRCIYIGHPCGRKSHLVSVLGYAYSGSVPSYCITRSTALWTRQSASANFRNDRLRIVHVGNTLSKSPVLYVDRVDRVCMRLCRVPT